MSGRSGKPLPADPPGLFWALTWRLELFTYLVPVPVSLYFSLVAVPLTPDQTSVALHIGIVAGVVIILAGSLWRYLRLRFIFERARRSGSDARLKDDLLSHPHQEAVLIVLRWVIGLPMAHVAFILLRSYQGELHVTLPLLLLTTVPISVMAYMTITTGVIRRVLAAPRFRSLALPAGRPILRVGYFTRILFTMVALILMPIAILGFLLVQTVEGRLTMQHPLLNIFAMLALFMIPATVAALELARAVRRGLSEANETLSMLGAGNFDVSTGIVTADEFGEHAQHLNNVIGHLRGLVGEIKQINASLEERVATRTEELRTTLEEVQALKTQQDGDYYLTSLLAAPLSQSTLKSDVVQVEAFVRQKKQFEFRNRKAEIGGDLCAAHEIQLRGERYVAFLNGDAMGKSMQGAGGAIVLGTVFKSVISRTRQADHQDLSPEEWLSDCFDELQNVFESFDGLMLASAVVGLLHEGSGTLFLFNAEHPQPVLYRNNQASFLPPRAHLTKLGVADLGDPFSVDTWALQPGDVIILGSDGRDELVTEQADRNARRINNDETLFLAHVQTAGAQLPLLFKTLEASGAIIDDCSLLRVSYQSASLGQPESNQVDTRRNRAQDLYWEGHRCSQADDWTGAASAFSQAANLDPCDSTWLYRAGYACKLARRFEEALDFAGRCRLREPGMLNNLINLADLQRLMGRAESARALLAKIRELEPKNEHAARLAEALGE